MKWAVENGNITDIKSWKEVKHEIIDDACKPAGSGRRNILHRKRQRERGYNQSREFALGLCSVLHIDLCDDAVERLRNTKSQASLVHGERSTNIKDAFGVVRPEALNGKHVLMVDDIVTTGATLSECIKAINKDTDARVSILTIGRAKH